VFDSTTLSIKHVVSVEWWWQEKPECLGKNQFPTNSKWTGLVWNLALHSERPNTASWDMVWAMACSSRNWLDTIYISEISRLSVYVSPAGRNWGIYVHLFWYLTEKHEDESRLTHSSYSSLYLILTFPTERRSSARCLFHNLQPTNINILLQRWCLLPPIKKDVYYVPTRFMLTSPKRKLSILVSIFTPVFPVRKLAWLFMKF
jgi:hypothetical protein